MLTLALEKATARDHALTKVLHLEAKSLRAEASRRGLGLNRRHMGNAVRAWEGRCPYSDSAERELIDMLLSQGYGHAPRRGGLLIKPIEVAKLGDYVCSAHVDVVQALPGFIGQIVRLRLRV